jgi:hypothetical protein
LLCSWILSALRPYKSYPILKLIGGQGSAKTTLANVARSLIDPNSAPLRRPPKSTEDLMVAANNGHLVAFDNLSYISPELSDGLCALSSGGSLGKRKMYSDDEETLLNAVRPILVNGIEDMGTRSDLMDRCVNVELPEIDEDKRLTDDEFWESFEAARPRVLGALYTALAGTLARLPEVKQKRRPWPRMAGFAQFSIAAAPALGFNLPGLFQRAYERSQAAAHQTALESSPVIPVLIQFMAAYTGGEWQGTATELLDQLTALAPDRRAKGWPKAPAFLTAILNRLAPNLKAAGWSIEQVRKGKNDKHLLIRTPRTPRTPENPTHSSEGGSGGEPGGLADELNKHNFKEGGMMYFCSLSQRGETLHTPLKKVLGKTAYGAYGAYGGTNGHPPSLHPTPQCQVRKGPAGRYLLRGSWGGFLGWFWAADRPVEQRL